MTDAKELPLELEHVHPIVFELAEKIALGPNGELRAESNAFAELSAALDALDAGGEGEEREVLGQLVVTAYVLEHDHRAPKLARELLAVLNARAVPEEQTRDRARRFRRFTRAAALTAPAANARPRAGTIQAARLSGPRKV